MTTTERPVVDFDHHSERFADGWRDQTAELRATCPVAWTDAHGGYWVVTGYDQVREVALDDGTYSSDNDLEGVRSGYQGVAIPRGPVQQIPIEVDPPLYDAYRRLLAPKFTPRAVEAWRPVVAEIAHAVVDVFCEKGELEIVEDLASPVPAILTMKLLGMPMDNWKQTATPFHEISWAVPGSELQAKAVEGLFGVLAELAVLLVERRSAPQDDLMSYLAAAELEGRPLTDDEVLQICFLQLIGGVDTSTGLLAHTFAWLSEHQEEVPRLLADPALLASATEEFLRWISPAPALARTVATETELGGQRLCPGDRVLISWASANQDETEFDHPEQVRLDREGNRHQAFGVGRHRCLGSNLARVVFQEVLKVALTRLTDLTVDLGGARRYPSLGQVNGFAVLPATFTPTPRLNVPFPT